MARSILISGGTIVTPSVTAKADVLVVDGIISRIGDCSECKADTTVDASGKIVSYGFADIHVHLREPGYSSKETIRTGTMAAAAGGYTLLCAMPNLNPCPDSVEHIAIEQSIIDRDAVVDVLPYAAITVERLGRRIVDMRELKNHCVAFSDDGSGVQNEEVMRKAMTMAATLGCTIVAHCEDNSLLRGGYIHDGEYARKHGHKGICSESEWGQIQRDLVLAKECGCRYHVCHISTAESVDIIRRAKAEGVRVTCETAPHYLTLTDNDLREDGRFKMNPPIRSARDREALLMGIKDGTIDAIATDHAPHTAEEKSRGLKSSAMGVTGLETAFPVLYTKLVRTGIVPLCRIIELLTVSPRRVFGISGSLAVGEKADLTIINPNVRYTIDSSKFLSMGHSTPFDGMEVEGKTVMTIKSGEIIYK